MLTGQLYGAVTLVVIPDWIRWQLATERGEDGDDAHERKSCIVARQQSSPRGRKGSIELGNQPAAWQWLIGQFYAPLAPRRIGSLTRTVRVSSALRLASKNRKQQNTAFCPLFTMLATKKRRGTRFAFRYFNACESVK